MELSKESKTIDNLKTLKTYEVVNYVIKEDNTLFQNVKTLLEFLKNHTVKNDWYNYKY